MEDFKRDMQIDEEAIKEAITEYFLQTEEERNDYRRYIFEIMTGKVKSRVY